jgi:hypothetical protein
MINLTRDNTVNSNNPVPDNILFSFYSSFLNREGVMKNMKRYTGMILAGCFILCTATALSAQDWHSGVE